jgi:hypothetical protein
MMLSRLRDKWIGLKQDIFSPDQVTFGPRDSNALMDFLAECKAAGRYISNSVDRNELQRLARESGDAMCAITDEYPDISIDAVTQAVNTPPEFRQSRTPFLPYDRNVFFSDREELLAQVSHALKSGKPVALCGTGGTGKTATALEYAYIHLSQ